jgi:hypothetical protein
MIFYYKEGVSVIECSKPKDFKLKMRERKLRSGVNWQEALKEKA